MSVHKYVVKGPNGKEYGPVDLVTLQEWVKQGRVAHDSKVRNLGNGMMLQASNMPELDGFFPGLYYQQNSAMASGAIHGKPSNGMEHWEDYKFAITMSVLGIILSFAIAWFSLIFCFFGVRRALEAARDQKPLSGLAVTIAILSFLAAAAIPFMMGAWVLRVIRGS